MNLDAEFKDTQVSPCDTRGLDKRSWGRARPFESDLDYMQMELDWLKARCQSFYYKSDQANHHGRSRFYRNNDDQDLSPRGRRDRYTKESSRAGELRKEINRRLAAHRNSDRPALALDVLCTRCTLTDFHRTLLLLAVAPCFSNQFEGYYGKLIGHDHDESLSIELVFRFFEFSFADRINYRVEFSSTGTLVAHDLINVELLKRYRNAKDLLQADIEIDNRTFSYLVGREDLSDEFLEFSSVQEPLSTLTQVVLPDEDKRRILSVVDDHDRYLECRSSWGFDEKISYGRGSMMLFYGPPGTGKTMTAHGIAHHLKKRVFNVDIPTFVAHREAEMFLPGLFREARLQNAVLFFDECEILFADRKRGGVLTTLLLTELERFEGVAIFATNLPQMLDEAFQRRVLVRVKFPEPDAKSRAMIWRSLIPERAPVSDDVDFELLGSRFEVAGGYIKNAVLSAVAEAVHSDRDPSMITMKMFETAARHQMDQVREGEDLSIPEMRLKDVILEARSAAQVSDVINSVRKLPVILNQWGVGGTGGDRGGIVALFHGPPGTGKTVCAEAIAGELNRPLLLARSSTILSKWVGESERNLSKLFKDAKAHGAVLFIDEADSLIGQRERSNSEHNRSMINLLLALIERHSGVVLLATNYREALDEALERRITHQVHLKRPDRETRARLWSSMLSDRVPGIETLDLDTLSDHYALSGAEIRVVLMRSATIAASSGAPLSTALLAQESHALLNGQKGQTSIGFSRGRSA